MAFQLTSPDKYRFVDVQSVPVTGNVYPKRAVESRGPLVLKAEDVALAYEAVRERTRLFTGDAGDVACWKGFPGGVLESDAVESPVALPLRMTDKAPYADVRRLCDAWAEPGQQVSCGSLATQGVGYVRYVDADAMLSTSSFSLDGMCPSSSGSITFADIAPTGGWPGDSGMDANVSAMAGPSDFVKAMFADALDSIKVPSCQDPSLAGRRALLSKPLRDCMEDVRRLGRLFVPCTIAGGATCVFSASGMPECVPRSGSDGGEDPCAECPWPSYREITLVLRTYAECLSGGVSSTFYPFLCWCMCPLWHGTAAWSYRCREPAFPELDRFVNFVPATSTPTFYFSWAALPGVCCPTVAGINGAAVNSSCKVSPDASFVGALGDDCDFEMLVAIYRCWHSQGPVNAIDYSYGLAARAFSVSGRGSVPLPADAVSAGTAVELLGRAGISDPAPSAGLHSDQVGVDLCAVYAVVKPGFRSDLSEFKGF
jgi:hypothetical protein